MTDSGRPPGIRRLFRIRGTPRSIRGDVEDEIRFHIESRVDELVAARVDPRIAREQAEREFGDRLSSARELAAVDRRRLGREQRGELFGSFVQDLKYAWRGLLRRPAATAVTLFALTVGIGANAVMFGVVDQLMLRPPAGVAAPSALRRIYFNATFDNAASESPVTTYRTITAMGRVPSFSGVAAFGYPRAQTLGHGTDAASVQVQLVSGNYFRLLGVALERGRSFTDDDDAPTHGAPIAIVSDGFWRSAFGSANDVIGRRIELLGRPFTVVGVAPRGFADLDRRRVDVWLPIAAAAGELILPNWHDSPNSFWVQAVVRLRDGVSPQLAAAQAAAAYRAEHATWEDYSNDTTATAVLGPLIGTRSPTGVSPVAKVSLWLMGVSLIVFLIACANVANLLIARTVDRRREIAVRLALGVNRGRLARQLLTESALIAAIAAALALIGAHFGAQLVEHVLLPGIVWTGSVLDARVLAFTLAAMVACVLLCGLAPAIHAARQNVGDALKTASRQVAGSRGVARATLLVVQAALSVLLLIGAGLFVKSLRNVAHRDVGITFDRVLLVTMKLSKASFPPAVQSQLYAAAVERARAIPGVAHAVAIAKAVPLRSAMAISLTVPTLERSPELAGGGPYVGVVPGDFFATVGARIVAGRAFTSAESRVPSRVAIVNQIVADAYWPGRNPVGACVRLKKDSTCTTIVGVAQNVMMFGIVNDDRAMIYVPPSHPSFGSDTPSAILVRTSIDPGLIAPLVRREIQSLSTAMPFVEASSYADLVAPQLQPWRLGATMFTVFGAIALLIAGIGLYSVLAYWVSQRQHEIGVRMALGARRADIVRLTAVQASRAVAVGLALGAIVAALSSRWIGPMLYDTSPRDPSVYIWAAAVLGAAALVACVIPARRSAAVDPATALRAD
ncbi:MAG: ADOP family duplicated permease [Gemmatimonadales bacterium]